MSCPESKDSCCTPACRTKAAYFVGALVVLLLGFGLDAMLKSYTETGAKAAREARAKDRAKALAEVRQVAAVEQSTAAVLDKGKGIHRIPIATAMELILKDYQKPEAGRSNFVARIEKFTAPMVLE